MVGGLDRWTVWWGHAVILCFGEPVPVRWQDPGFVPPLGFAAMSLGWVGGTWTEPLHAKLVENHSSRLGIPIPVHVHVSSACIKPPHEQLVGISGTLCVQMWMRTIDMHHAFD